MRRRDTPVLCPACGKRAVRVPALEKKPRLSYTVTRWSMHYPDRKETITQVAHVNRGRYYAHQENR